MGPRDIQLVEPGLKWQGAFVYRVSISPDLRERWPKQPATYLVVAMHEGAVKSYLERRYTKIAVRQMGLARAACSEVMRKLVNNAPKEPRAGKRAEGTARKNAFVLERKSGDSFVLSIKDNISYSELAVKGGRAGIDLSLKKAANKISANIRRKFGKFLSPGEISTPFPEVKRRRAS